MRRTKSLLAITIATLLFANNSFAQIQEELLDAVVTSFRYQHRLSQMPAPIFMAQAYDYKQQSAFTLSNVLGREAGIAMGGDGIWATNVNIRGFGEDRLVTLVDGCRVETATDLTAALSMINPDNVARVEVIKGALSSLYGTGAMGGIINIITKDGSFYNKLHASGEVIGSFSSVNKKYTTYGSVNAGSKRWYLRLSGSYNKAQNVLTPKGILENSQFQTSDFSAKLGVKTFENHTFKAQFQYNDGNDIGIPGGSAFPGPAKAKYSDINRMLIDANYEITDITDKLKSLKFSYFRQHILRDVELQPNTITDATLPNGNIQRTIPNFFRPHATHTTNGGVVQGTWDLSKNNSLIVGADVWSREMISSRKKDITMKVLKINETVIKENSVQRFESPLPKSTFTSAGIFVQDETHFAENRATLIAGGRIDAIFISNEKCYDVDSVILNGIKQTPAQRTTFEAGKNRSLSWSANIGVLYRVGRMSELTLNLARSFRAPSLEERFKFIDLGNLVRIGDPNLKPENGYSAEIGFRVRSEVFALQASAYTNLINNYVVEKHGEFESTPALICANVSKALLSGFDLSAHYYFCNHFGLSIVSSFVRGRDIVAKGNLPMIPPFRNRVSLSYSLPAVGSAEISLTAANKQDKVAEGEKATDGYMKGDLLISSTRIPLGQSTGLQIFAGVDNITNKAYTNHLSTNRGSISFEPGRNFFARICFSF